jgi:hypothetical protein
LSIAKRKPEPNSQQHPARWQSQSTDLSNERSLQVLDRYVNGADSRNPISALTDPTRSPS